MCKLCCQQTYACGLVVELRLSACLLASLPPAVPVLVLNCVHASHFICLKQFLCHTVHYHIIMHVLHCACVGLCMFYYACALCMLCYTCVACIESRHLESRLSIWMLLLCSAFCSSQKTKRGPFSRTDACTLLTWRSYQSYVSSCCSSCTVNQHSNSATGNWKLGKPARIRF